MMYISNKGKQEITMELTEKQAQAIFEKASTTDLLEIFDEIRPEEEEIMDIETYITEFLTEPDDIRDFIENIQDNSKVDITDSYIYIATYYSDWKTADEVEDLLTQEVWVMFIQDYYADIDDEDEDDLDLI